MIHPRVPGGGSSITFYNERDQATEAQVHDLHGNRVGRVLASCDADGRLTEDQIVALYRDLVFGGVEGLRALPPP